MDLKDFDLSKSEEGSVLTLTNPVTYEPLDAQITLVGRDSSRYRNKIREIANRNKAAQKGRQKTEVDYDKAFREGAEILAACTLGWDGISEGGEEVEFSEDRAQQLYMEHPWIREQVDDFVAQRANFFRESSTA